MFGHFWNCQKWNLVKKIFCEIGLFDFTSFFDLDFVKFSGPLCNVLLLWSWICSKIILQVWLWNMNFKNIFKKMSYENKYVYLVPTYYTANYLNKDFSCAIFVYSHFCLIIFTSFAQIVRISNFQFINSWGSHT